MISFYSYKPCLNNTMFLSNEQIFIITIFFFSVCLSAFFSGTEAAFLSIQKVRLSSMENNGVPGAKRLRKFTEEPTRFLPTLLLGNNLANTLAAALGTALSFTFYSTSSTAIVISTIIVTAILLIFGEMIPKTFGAKKAEQFAMGVLTPIIWFEKMFFPFIKILQFISLYITKIFRLNWNSSKMTQDDLKGMINIVEDEGSIDTESAEMLENVFHFGEKQVLEIMTPRTEIIFLDKTSTIDKFLSIYSENYHSWFPVFEDVVDNVIGRISTKDIMREITKNTFDRNQKIEHLIRPIHQVPETKTIASLFSELKQRNEQIAITVDEFGGVAGLVTLRKLIEVIVGPVEDEDVVFKKTLNLQGENIFEVEGAMSINEANEKIGLNIPDGEYQTLAGFVLEQFRHLPQNDESIQFNNFWITIKKMDKNKIELLEITKQSIK